MLKMNSSRMYHDDHAFVSFIRSCDNAVISNTVLIVMQSCAQLYLVLFNTEKTRT